MVIKSNSLRRINNLVRTRSNPIFSMMPKPASTNIFHPINFGLPTNQPQRHPHRPTHMKKPVPNQQINLAYQRRLNDARVLVNKDNRKNLPKPGSHIKPYMSNIEKDTLENDNWRKTPYTGFGSQVVLMSINPKDSIENEVHPHVDQFFRVEEGEAKFVLDNGKIVYEGQGGTGVVVPQGHWHQVYNTSKTKKLKLYTIYSPSNHPPNTTQKTHPKND